MGHRGTDLLADDEHGHIRPQREAAEAKDEQHHSHHEEHKGTRTQRRERHGKYDDDERDGKDGSERFDDLIFERLCHARPSFRRLRRVICCIFVRWP